VVTSGFPTIKILNQNIFDTTDSYGEQPFELKASCYVVQHGNEYMLWDAGFNPEAIAGVTEDDMFQPTIPNTIPEALAKIDLEYSEH